MGFRFRKSISIMPGVRVNLSKSGSSVSLGRGGATVNVGPRGTFGTVGVPGSGLSYRRRIGKRTASGSGTALLVVIGFFMLCWALGHFLH